MDVSKILLASVFVFSTLSQAQTLHLKYETFDPIDGLSQDLPPTLVSEKSSELRLVQFKNEYAPKAVKKLESLGYEVLRYIPHGAFVVRTNVSIDDIRATLVEKEKVARWVGPFHPAFKLEPALLQRYLNRKLAKSENLVVVLADKEDRGLVDVEVEIADGKVLHPGKESSLMEVSVSGPKFLELTRSDRILWIESLTKPELDMDNARIQGGADYLGTVSTETTFTGAGIQGHVLEGVDPTHPDFIETSQRSAPIPFVRDVPTSHGTKTFGQIFGSGANRPAARGILPDAQGVYTDYGAVMNSNPGPGEPASRYNLVRRLIEEHRVMFQTASWGYGRTQSYNSRSREMDELIFELDIPITQSQSNAGNQNSRPQAWAKNIISVGGLRHRNNSDPADDYWGNSGSIGPAADGRIKPDMSAYYDSILTQSTNGNYTTSFGGTSGATPIVAGHVGLIMEMWGSGIFPDAVLDPMGDHFDNRPHFTTVKALLFTGAEQYDFTGTSDDRTRVHQGWGFPSVRHLYDYRESSFVINESEVLSQGDTKTVTLNVAANTPSLKISMVYNEPPAATSSTIQLINNLDLKLTAPDGAVYWGNNGLLAATASTPGGAADTFNNVENIFIDYPTDGTWTLEINAANIVMDSHLETTDIDADFALAVLGANATL